MYTDMYQTEFNNLKHFDCRQLPQKICWKYGDTVFLNFELQNIDIQDPTASLCITFYNYEFEPVHMEVFYVTEVKEPVLHYMLDACPASKIFRPGIYYCGLTHRHIDEGYEIIKTIVNPNEFIINVI